MNSNVNRKCYRNEQGIFVSMTNGTERVINRHILLGAAMRRIRAQFPSNPESKLMLAVIQQAVSDTLDKSLRPAAISYLKGDMKHALLAGVEPTWIRETLTEVDCFEPLPGNQTLKEIFTTKTKSTHTLQKLKNTMHIKRKENGNQHNQC